MDFDHDKQHEFSPLEQAGQSKRKDLKKNCEILEKAVANSDKETQVLNEDMKSLSNNFTMTQHLINERKQQLLAKILNTVDTKTNTMIEDARRVFDGKKNKIEEEIHEKKSFFKRVKVSAEMARSLLENGDDEEIVRSYQSVQENVDNATKTECDRRSYHVDTALSWSSDEIDKMLLAEVKDIVEDKGIINFSTIFLAKALELLWFPLLIPNIFKLIYVYISFFKMIPNLRFNTKQDLSKGYMHEMLLHSSLMFTKTIIVKFNSLCSGFQILKPGVICLVCGKTREPSSSNNLSGREGSVNVHQHLSTRTSSIYVELARCLQLKKVYATSENGTRIIEWESPSQAMVIRERCLITCLSLVWSDSCFLLRVLKAKVPVGRGDHMM
jgi:hypothetical protein